MADSTKEDLCGTKKWSFARRRRHASDGRLARRATSARAERLAL